MIDNILTIGLAAIALIGMVIISKEGAVKNENN